MLSAAGKYSTICIASLFALAGCSATGLSDTAGLVRLTRSEPDLQKCRFLGDATGSQGDFLFGSITSNSALETGARNDLKNKAASMGGNVVYLLTDRAGQTANDGELRQTNVTISGGVYACAEPASQALGKK
ncbi:MAG: DUF4156 domain-containing protein [Achromobacter sp.]